MGKEGLRIITKINVQNKEVYLCDDGNLYEKGLNDEYILLKGVDEDSKKLIEKIMNKFKPIETDVKREGKEKKTVNKEIEVELPEI